MNPVGFLSLGAPSDLEKRGGEARLVDGPFTFPVEAQPCLKHPRDLPPSVMGHPSLKRGFHVKDFCCGFKKRTDQLAFVQCDHL